MTEIIRPILGDPLKSTKRRFYSLFKPIQAIDNEKASDFLAFFLTPLLDYAVLNPIYAVDILIHTVNFLATLLKIPYVWALNQQKTSSLLDHKTREEIDSLLNHTKLILGSLVAMNANIILSTLSLITRPIASIVEAVSSASKQSSDYEAFS